MPYTTEGCVRRHQLDSLGKERALGDSKKNAPSLLKLRKKNSNKTYLPIENYTRALSRESKETEPIGLREKRNARVERCMGS